MIIKLIFLYFLKTKTSQVPSRHQSLQVRIYNRFQTYIRHFTSTLSQMIEEQPTRQAVNQVSLQKEPLGPDPSKERFQELLKKLQELNKCVQNTQSFQKFYNIIGLTRQTIIAGLQAIYEYFVLLGHQIDEGLIRKHVGHRLIEGVHSYLELQKFQELQGKYKALYILQFETKFSVCLQFFHTVKQHQSNITSEDQAKYSHVWKHIEFVSIGDKKELQKKYNSMKKMLILTTTAVISQQEVEWSFSKKIFFGLSYPRYYVDYATARLKSFIFYKYPTIKLAKSIWNIPQLGASKELIKIVFDSIRLNKKIYIPIKFDDEDYPNIFQEGQGKVQVRILNHEQLYFKTKPVRKSFLPCCTQDDTRDYKEINSIIIHMHGGGFIALSSRMMQTITRKWANQLKIPIFSIDYRKPPNDPFPAAPNDCFAVYKFIVTKIKKYMNINPVNIYLAGDSAGGNLACSLMGSILKNNLPSPKGIYLAYPAVDLRVQFSPSKIHAVTDPLLWPSMLMLCLNEYLGGNLQNSNNPLASPVLLTEQYVGGQPNDKRFPLKWPKTIISVGELDPMYDDSLLLMQKMQQSNIECKCRVYKDISHGFLSTDLMISECALTLRDSIKDLKELIGFEEKKKPKKSTSSKVQQLTSKTEKEINKSPKQLKREKSSKIQGAQHSIVFSQEPTRQSEPLKEEKK